MAKAKAPDTRTAIERKAHEYLAAGRIKVAYVDVESREAVLGAIGSAAEPYTMRFHDDVWTCTCPAQVDLCAHVQAAGLIIPLRTAKDRLGIMGDNPELDAWFDKSAPTPEAEEPDYTAEWMVGDV